MLTSLLVGYAASKGLLVVDTLAIGRLENGKWSNLASKPSDPVSKLRNISFMELGLSEPLGRLTIPKLDLQSDVADGWYAINEKWSNKVLWSGTAVKVPKMNIWRGMTKPTFRDIKNFLIAKGLKDPRLNYDRLVQADLDADGKMETIVEVSSVKDPTQRTQGQGPKNDFTAILIEWGHGKCSLVSMNDARKDGVLAAADQLRAVVDFDGDGRYELVCSANYYEGQSAAVYSYRAGVVRKLVEYGAGV